MDWVWVTALVWTALALPLAFVTGRYLIRSDRQERYPVGPADVLGGVPGTMPPAVEHPPAPRTSARRRSGPSPAVSRVIHPAGRPATGRDLAGHPPGEQTWGARQQPPEQDVDGDRAASRFSSRRRSPMHRRL